MLIELANCKAPLGYRNIADRDGKTVGIKLAIAKLFQWYTLGEILLEEAMHKANEAGPPISISHCVSNSLSGY